MAKVTHGLSKHPLHNVWHGIKCRCYGKTSNGYSAYGAVGVVMCEDWRLNFKSFFDWAIANGWQKGLQVDKDIKANEMGLEPNLYSPERCSIVTAKRNSNNRTSNRKLEYNGKSLTISQWADETGIPRNAIRMRIEMHGFTVEQALTNPIFKKRKQPPCFMVDYNGRNQTLAQWATELNSTPKDIKRSLDNGKPFDEIYKRYASGKKRIDARK